MTKIPYIVPVFGSNAPALFPFKPQIGPTADSIVYLSGRLFYHYDAASNTSVFYQIDDTITPQQICVDQTRRLLLIGGLNINEQLCVDVIHIASRTRLAHLYIYESACSSKQLLGIAASPDLRWISGSTAGPENLVATWLLPVHVMNYCIKQEPGFQIHVSQKYTSAFKQAKPASELEFRPTENGILLFCGGCSSYDIYALTEYLIKYVATLNVKRLSMKLDQFSFGDYSAALVKQSGEVLVLRGELMIGFYPLELLSCKLYATTKTTFVPLNYSRIDDEAVICIRLIGNILVAGTSSGRVHVFCTKRFESDSGVAQTCRAAGGMALNVVEAFIVLTQSFGSPVQSIDYYQSKYMLSLANGAVYVSTSLTEGFVRTLADIYQYGDQKGNVNLMAAYDGVAKLKALVGNSSHLKLNDAANYLLSPSRHISKLNVVGLDGMDQLAKAFSQSPTLWPEFLFSSQLAEPFKQAFNKESTALVGLEQKVYHYYLSGKTFGPGFSMLLEEVTDVSCSEEQGIFYIATRTGRLLGINADSLQPVIDWSFQLAEYVSFKESQVEDDDDADLLVLGQVIASQDAKGGTDFVDEDVSKRKYAIDCVAAHPSGLQLVVAAHCLDYKFQKLSSCVCVLNILQGDVYNSTIIEQEDNVIQLEFDVTGNYLYCLTPRILQVFSFFEMRLVVYLDLNIRIKFINPLIYGYFERAEQERYDKANAQLQVNAMPTRMKINKTGGYCFISFADGDVACFDVFLYKVVMKYVSTVNVVYGYQKFLVDFQIMSITDFNADNIKLYKLFSESNGGIFHVPLIAAFSDGQVTELHLKGNINVICNAGVNSSNGEVSRVLLLHGWGYAEQWLKQSELIKDLRNEELVGALILSQTQKDKARENVLVVGDKGILQLYYLSQQNQKGTVYQFHQQPVKHCALLSESTILTVSADGQILISKLQYGAQTPRKFNPKAGLHANSIIRSRPLQQALDLLLFELLLKLFVVQAESDKQLNEVRAQAELEMRKAHQDFVTQKNAIAEEIASTTERNNRLVAEKRQVTQNNEYKLQYTYRELEQTYQDYVKQMKLDAEALQSKYLQMSRQYQTEEDTFRTETQQSMQREQSATIYKIEELKTVYRQLQEDERGLRTIADQYREEYAERYETEVTRLRADLEKKADMESGEVKKQRELHYQMEKQFNLIQKELGTARYELAKKKNESAGALKQLYLAKHQLSIYKSDLEQKYDVKIRKEYYIKYMAQEKEDLLKMRRLLYYRADDLKQCMAPRDDAIASYYAYIQEMDAELLKDMGQKKKAELDIQDLMKKRQTAEYSIKEKQEDIEKIEGNIRSLLFDLSSFCQSYAKDQKFSIEKSIKKLEKAEFVTLVGEYKDYSSALKVIFAKHIRKEMSTSLYLQLKAQHRMEPVQRILADPALRLVASYKSDAQGIYYREYLEKSVYTLTKALDRRRSYLNYAIERSRQQSSTLLGFSNLMRRENKEIYYKLRDCKYRLAKKKYELLELSAGVLGKEVNQLLDEDGGAADSNSITDSSASSEDENLTEHLETNYPAPGVRVEEAVENIDGVDRFEKPIAGYIGQVLPRIPKKRGRHE